MKKIIVIGAGIAGIFTCLRLLEKGYFVTLVSPAQSSRKIFKREDNFSDMINKTGGLEKNFKRFYDNSISNIDLEPGSDLFKYPTGRKLFSSTNSILSPRINLETKDYNYLASDKLFGLGAGWGANLRKFNDLDVMDWPINLSTLYKFDKSVSKHFYYENAKVVKSLGSFLKKRFTSVLNGFVDIRDSKLAIDSKKCVECGLCIWGCSHNAIFSPEDIYKNLLKEKNFNHVFGFADSISGSNDHVEGVWVREPSEKLRFFSADHLVLSGGPLSSFSLLSDFICETKGLNKVKSQLMDTTCIRVPAIDFAFKPEEYQQNRVMFNEFTFDWRLPNSDVSIQGEIMKLNSILLSGFLLQKPFNAVLNFIFLRALINRLYSISLFMSSNIEKSAKVEFVKIDKHKCIKIFGQKNNLELRVFSKFQNKLRRKLIKGGFLLLKKRPSKILGSGIHYAGTIPMQAKSDKICSVNEFGRHQVFKNLWVSDSSTFPSLPSKSLTFTIACNAMRVADNV